MIPMALTVVCTDDSCPVGGRPARVYLRLVALDVVEWPDLRCVRCGSQMASKDSHEGESMAKITVHGGPTNERADPPTPPPAPAEPVLVVAQTPTDTPVDVPAEQTTAAPEETDQAAEVPAEASAPKKRGRPRKAVTT